MPFKINRRPTWIGTALNRVFGAGGGSGDTINPELVPDVILPALDIFGWQRFQEMTSQISVAALGVESVFPVVDANWPDGGGGTGVVPNNVGLRMILAMHIQSIGIVASLIMWFGVLDRGGGSTGIPTETGTGTAIPQDTPLNIIRPVFLRPTEQFVGRVRGLNPAAQLQANYTWIDFPEGEYLHSVP